MGTSTASAPLPQTATGRPLGRRPPRTPHHGLRLARGATPLDALPVDVDLRPLCPAVQDQGQEGSCTGHALAGGIGVLCARATHDGTWRDTSYTPSRAYIYYQERLVEGDTDQDAGANLGDGLRVVMQGVPAESTMPYSDLTYDVPPPPAAVASAGDHAVTNGEPIALDLGTLLGTLAQGYPIVCGVQVCQSFEDAGANGAHGDVPLPSANEPVLGGHAILLVGYDRARNVVRFRNSWGTSWGDQGYGTLPFAFVENSSLFDEAYVLRAVR